MKKRLLYDINSEKYRAAPGVHKVNGWAMYDQHNYDTGSAECPRCETLYENIRMNRIRNFNVCISCESGAREEGTPVENVATSKAPLLHSRFDAMTVPGERLREATHEFSKNIYDEDALAVDH